MYNDIKSLSLSCRTPELIEAEAGISPLGERLRVTSHAGGEEEIESGS